MHICLIFDNPETPRHPVISAALQQLGTRHTVRLLDVAGLTGAQAVEREMGLPLADLFLLKSHAPQALDLARQLEGRGARVVNSWAASLACQDRALMAQRMREAGLPWPQTWHYPTLSDLLSQPDLLAALPFPLILKSAYSHRGDLVQKVYNAAELAALAADWSQEPVIVQAFAAGDGWDTKFWVIGEHLYAARRRSTLEANTPAGDVPLTPEQLPDAWVTLVREIGRVFDLRLYGADLLLTAQGPLIVDVNAFPGFRGAPGADAALVALVEQVGQEQTADTVSRPAPSLANGLSIPELPVLLVRLLARAGHPLAPEAAEPLGLFVRYLRRKPGRGLAVIYHVDAARRRREHIPSSDPSRSVSLTLDETALAGSSIRFAAAQADQAPLEIAPAGAVRAKGLGLAVQAFPADDGLPTLAASCATDPQSQVFRALEAAAQQQLGDTAWRLMAARAEPVRYKPGNRCVIRYHLRLERPPNDQRPDSEAADLYPQRPAGDADDPAGRREYEEQPAQQRNLTLYGKLYADPEQARAVHALQQQLYDMQQSDGAGPPMLPRPLGLVEALGLTVQEAAQADDLAATGALVPTAPLLSGPQALRPQVVRGRGGVVSAVQVPQAALTRTAHALARLHHSRLRLDEAQPRTGAKEAKRARERAALIAGYHPAQAGQVKRLAEQLATRLADLQPDTYLPAHGGFKSSQLLFGPQQVFVVDFDGLCLADPALDVGYFLAYLRPSGLWHRRPGMRQWYEAAAAVFRGGYCEALQARGLDSSAINGIVARSPLYEAALLFKIATRRVNRLNSPRPGELAAMLNEIADCLNGRERSDAV